VFVCVTRAHRRGLLGVCVCVCVCVFVCVCLACVRYTCIPARTNAARTKTCSSSSGRATVKILCPPLLGSALRFCPTPVINLQATHHHQDHHHHHHHRHHLTTSPRNKAINIEHDKPINIEYDKPIHIEHDKPRTKKRRHAWSRQHLNRP